MKETTRSRIAISVALAALWLSACGGGGGDTVAAAPTPAPAPAAGGGAPAPATAVVGTSWTAQGPSDVWHSLSSSGSGQVMVAGQAATETQAATSFLSVSNDGGVTWTERTTLAPGIWISSDVSTDGTRIAAVQFQGNGLFTSVDSGATFIPVTSPAGVAANSRFESVTLTPDGTRVAAVILGGRLIVGDVSATGEVTFITPTGLPATAGWRSIDSSATGNVMVAVAQDPLAFISRDRGATWTPLTVSVGGTTVADQNWYRVKVSNDGKTIALAANQFGGSAGNGIYVSKDAGATFTRGHSQVGNYSSIAMSDDGGVVAATLSNPNLLTNDTSTGTGSVLLSTNGGLSFTALPITVGGATAPETDWRAITISGDATRMAVAAGRFENNGTGPIYLSTGTRPATTAAPAATPAAAPATP